MITTRSVEIHARVIRMQCPFLRSAAMSQAKKVRFFIQWMRQPNIKLNEQCKHIFLNQLELQDKRKFVQEHRPVENWGADLKHCWNGKDLGRNTVHFGSKQHLGKLPKHRYQHVGISSSNAYTGYKNHVHESEGGGRRGSWWILFLLSPREWLGASIGGQKGLWIHRELGHPTAKLCQLSSII